MIAVKTFDATGVAPNGKLYAGDLNAIQAAAAALVDFTQTIDLGSVRIGESGLTLSRIGSLEAQLSGDFRVTKIIRGLEGFIPGAFTTTQRDALAAGRAPYGLALLNTTKNKWEWNTGSDVARVWQPFGIDSLINTLANRPAANSVVPGSTFWATDQAVEYVSDGTNWLRKSLPAGATLSWFAAAAPTGWVKYDGSNLPASTGIYADLSTHLGGIATPNTKGRVIVGQDTGDVDWDAILETRGAKTHTLSGAEMAHDHSMQGHTHVPATGDATFDNPSGLVHLGDDVATSGPSVANVSAVQNVTAGAHNNIQPSIVALKIGKL
jgi:hypothetical protein